MKKNLFDRLGDAWRSFIEEPLEVQQIKSSTVPALSVGSEFSYPSTAPRKQYDYIRSYSGWVYSAVKSRSQDVSEMCLKLFKVSKDRTETEELMDHDVLSLLRQVNPWMTHKQLMEYTQAYKDLSGEAFWYLVKSNNSKKILQIWLLRPDYMTIETDPTKFIVGYTYTVPGASPVKFGLDEIIHFKDFNPIDPYRGMSIVQAAAWTIDTEAYAEKYNARFFQNSAIPSVVLKTPQKLDDSILKRMRMQWNNEFSGVDRAHKLAILEGGLDVSPFSVTRKDMEFLEGQAFNRDKILALFQVPKSRLGMTEGISVSNTDASIGAYLKYTVKPLMQAMCDVLNEFLIPQFPDGESLYFSFEDPTPENKEVKLSIYKTLFEVGAITPNEIRAREGLDTVDGLDQFYLPANYVLVDDLNGANQDYTEPVKGLRPKKNIRIPALTLAQRIGRDVSESIKNKVITIMAKSIKTKQIENVLGPTHLTLEQQDSFWKAYVDKSINYEKSFKSAVESIFDRQEKETITRLNRTQKAITRGDVEEIIFNLSTENKLTAQVLVPLLRKYFEEAGNEALDLVGSDVVFDMGDATVREFFRKRALQGIKRMNNVTKKTLRAILSEAVREGLSIDQVSRNIRDLFGESKKIRSDRIARTEIMRAGNDATLAGYNQSGVVAGKQWYTALDERVCEWCGPMQGRVKALDTSFFIKGEDFLGNQGHVIKLSFEDIDAPPLHPSCRCVMLPIVGEARTSKPGTGKEVEIDHESMRAQLREELKLELEKDITEKVKAGVDEEIGKIADALP